jgi:hypothetical protein
MKKIIMIGSLTLGCVSLGVSSYIDGEVKKGQQQISSAEGTVGTLDKLSSLSPFTKPLGDNITSSADKKIAAGQDEIAFYQTVSMVLKITGVILLLISAIAIAKVVMRKK